jgi:hypothetical protein
MSERLTTPARPLPQPDADLGYLFRLAPTGSTAHAPRVWSHAHGRRQAGPAAPDGRTRRRDRASRIPPAHHRPGRPARQGSEKPAARFPIPRIVAAGMGPPGLPVDGSRGCPRWRPRWPLVGQLRRGVVAPLRVQRVPPRREGVLPVRGRPGGGDLVPADRAFLVRRPPRNAVGWLLILTSVLGITPWLSPECLLGDALVADSYCARTAIRIVAVHQPHLLFATDNYSGSETATGGPTNPTQLARPTRPGSADLPAANEHVNVSCLRRRHRPLIPTRPPRQAQNRQQHRHRRPDRHRGHRQEPRRPRLRQGRHRRGHSDRLSITATP